MSLTGFFHPKNPKKYRGDINNIVYRSSWELRVMTHFDASEAVEWWSSEETIVPYTDYSTTPPSFRRYFPDFMMGKISGEVYMVEVKPMKEALPPLSRQRITRSYIKEVKTFAKNQSKWEAAKRYCDMKGWKFMILTEKEIYGSIRH